MTPPPRKLGNLAALLARLPSRPEPPCAHLEIPFNRLDLGPSGSQVAGNPFPVRLYVLPPGGWLDLGCGTVVVSQEVFDELVEEGAVQ